MKNYKFLLLLLFALLTNIVVVSCDVVVNITRGMVVKQGDKYIAYNTGRYDFGFVTVGDTSTKVEFRIENHGSEDLRIDRISLTLGDVDDFEIDLSFTAPVIPANYNTVFSMAFTPLGRGDRLAIVSIETDSEDYNPYAFTVVGTEYSPEISVSCDSVEIPNNTGSYDFGVLNPRSAIKEVIFTIENSGTETLTLTGSPVVLITGVDANLFFVSQQPNVKSIETNENTTFIIKYTPVALGSCAAVVSISNNDSDENPYTFAITGQYATPEINVKCGSVTITSGVGVADFGNIYGASSETKVFTIENIGSADLLLTGNPKVVINGRDAIMFSVKTQPNSPVAAAGSSSFSIEFTPLNNGVKTASVSIASNDVNENPYTFTITGSSNFAWSDGFEYYTPGAWPFVNWYKDGYANYVNWNYVDNIVFYEGVQSLRLYGLSGRNHLGYIAYAHRPLEVLTTNGSKFEICMRLRNGDELIPATGNQDRAMVYIRTNRYYNHPARQLIRFNKDGNIYISNSQIRRYNSTTWYYLRMRYERMTDTNVRITYWLDNVRIHQDNLSATSHEDDYRFLTIAAGAGTAWFDDIKIFR